MEPLEMLEETVAALVALDYPHDTWVLDEGNDEEVRELCRRLGARHFSRKHLHQYQQATGPHEARTKHGNYNAWLAEVGFGRYDLIAAFDPDHIPERDFLSRVVGYFDDPRIGYVQSAQVYYNQKASFIARGAAEDSLPESVPSPLHRGRGGRDHVPGAVAAGRRRDRLWSLRAARLAGCRARGVSTRAGRRRPRALQR